MFREVLTLFVVLLIAQSQSFPNESSESNEYDPYQKRKDFEQSGCLENENVEIDEILDSLTLRDNGLEYVKQKFEGNPKLKCFTSCYYEYLDLLYGCAIRYNEDLKKILETGPLQKIFDDFENRTSSETDRCECGYQLTLSFMEVDYNESEN